MDRYDNFTIYFAELKHLVKWGQRITADDVSEDASNIKENLELERALT